MTGTRKNDIITLNKINEKRVKYLGNMSATFAFKGDIVQARFFKAAEYFLEEYQGSLKGKKRRN